MSDFEDFQIAVGEVLIALGRVFKEALLTIGECIVKVMDWMNE